MTADDLYQFTLWGGAIGWLRAPGRGNPRDDLGVGRVTFWQLFGPLLPLALAVGLIAGTALVVVHAHLPVAQEISP